jgi:hypothetical protein
MPGGERDKEATFGAAVKTIFWSFFGVRRRAHHESETVRLKPAHIVVTGLVAAAIFVVVLVTLARFIVGATNG